MEAGETKAKTKTHKKQAGKRETSSVAVNSADFVVLVIFPTRGFSSLEAGLEDGAVRKGRENELKRGLLKKLNPSLASLFVLHRTACFGRNTE